MDSFEVRITVSAEAELRRVPFPFRRQINQRIMALQKTPLPESVESLESNRCFVRIGDYGVLYLLDGLRVTVLAIVGAPAAH